jgi:hypothetical protein
VDAGKTWSSWYNQPTGQFYHVSTDNLFPYRAYAAQQDSGTAGVLSRSDYGEILLQDWYSIGGFEYAFITPDPAHPNLVYSGGWYGTVVRYDKSTGQSQPCSSGVKSIAPRKCHLWSSRPRARPPST